MKSPFLSNTNSPTPLDVWAPSGKYIKPQFLHQVAIGYFRNFKDNQFSLEVETFYKTIENRIDYTDGANLIANNAIEQIILNGKARAYGVEVLLKKNDGLLKGWLSYTLSKSEQQTKGRNEIESGINNGNWYNTAFNKTHDISLTTTYDINKRWSFSSNFIFQSGQPTTYPLSQYQYNGITIPNFGDRNANNLPSYHRLDLSFNLTPKKNKNRKLQAQWVFGLYNVYNRKNAASINFRQDNVTGTNEAVRLSIFGIVPYVKYNFKF